MSRIDDINIDKLVALAEQFEKTAKDFEKAAEAKARSRGKVALPAEHPKVNDNKDHYPTNNADQARNALARVSQHPSAPSWFKGSLSELQNIVRRFVKKHYPSIEVSSPKKKASIEVSEAMLNKYSDYKVPSPKEEMAIEWAEKMLRDSGAKVVSAGPEAWDIHPPLSRERIKVDGWKALVQLALRITAPLEPLHEKEVLAHSEK